MSATVIALATTLTIILVLAIVIISLLYVRARPKSSDNSNPFGILSSMTPSDPTVHITPFGSSSQIPIFNHEPGKNMRVAHRRADGGWDFIDSELSCLESFPRPPESVYSADGGSPVPSVPRSASSAWSQYPSSKSQEFRVHATCPRLVALPPPAYSVEDSVSANSLS